MSKRNSMLDRLQSRLAEQIGHRGDLYIADHKTINAEAAKMLLGYENDIGNITSDDVARFIYSSFGGKLVPVMGTARVHNEGAISLFVRKAGERRAYREIESMTKIGSTRAICKLGEVWDVREGTDGEKYLSRLVKDDIEELLRERRARMQIKSAHVRFDTLRTAGIVELWAGDRVRVYQDSMLHKGEVVSVKPDTVAIRAESGILLEIPREAVMDVIDRGEAYEAHMKEYSQSYFERAFGDREYARRLTQDGFETTDQFKGPHG